jgi:phosphatidylinositol 4-kinase
LDQFGRIVHIDFGFLLSRTVPFEKAPFKLSPELIEVMGGHDSPCFRYFCALAVQTYLAVRKQYRKIVLLMEMTMLRKGRKVLPCLADGVVVINDFVARLHLDWDDEKCKNFVYELVEEARGSWRTIVVG